ncbi:MAG: Gfo/Idh/MocA family oxidoreductase [Mycobacterium sp.]
MQNGEFGKVNMIRGHFGGVKRPRNDSGVMFADGIHFVDLFNFILGALPKSVLAIRPERLWSPRPQSARGGSGSGRSARSRPIRQAGRHPV